MTEVRDLDRSLAQYGQFAPTKDRFMHCYGFSCRRRPLLSFDEAEWHLVVAIFERDGMPRDAAAERVKLALAVGQIERIVGEKDGTKADLGGSFIGYGRQYQLDCYDEMLNTATYVRLLIHEGLITFHEPGHRLTNNFFRNGALWPHTVSTIRDKATGEEWAIDSWWLKNGAPPYIVTRRDWSDGTWAKPKSDKEKRAVEAAWDEQIAKAP